MKKQDKFDKHSLRRAIMELDYDAESELTDMVETIENFDEDYIAGLYEAIQRMEEKYKELSQNVMDFVNNPYKEKETAELEEIKQNIELLKLRKEYLPGLMDCDDRLELAKMLAETRNKVEGNTYEDRTEPDLMMMNETDTCIYNYKGKAWIDVNVITDCDEESLPIAELNGLSEEEMNYFIDYTHYCEAFVYVDRPGNPKGVKKVLLCRAEYYSDSCDEAFMDEHVMPALEEKLPGILKEEFGVEM